MSAIPSQRAFPEPDWHGILESHSSLNNYLKARVDLLTDELLTLHPRYEKTTLPHRIKWIAQIIYHSARVIFYTLGKGLATCICSRALHRKCSILFFDAATRLYSRYCEFSCHQELLIKGHNGPNLERSKIAFKTDLEYNGSPFDASNLTGNCAGMQLLFTLLFLRTKLRFPDIDSKTLIEKIATLLSNGALPEAMVLQPLQNSKEVRELFVELFDECHTLLEIRPEKRELDCLFLDKSETTIDKLQTLTLDKPYFLTTRTWITGRCHSTCLIRTGQKEYYWYNSVFGLAVFSGASEMKKLINLWGYGPLTEGERQVLQHNKITMECYPYTFCERHKLSSKQASLVKQVDEMMKRGATWEKVKKDLASPENTTLLQHYFQDRSEIETLYLGATETIAPPMEAALLPYSYAIVSRNYGKGQGVKCHSFSGENHAWEDQPCPLLSD